MLFQTASYTPLTIALSSFLLIGALVSFFTFDVFGQRKLAKDFGCYLLCWVSVGAVVTVAFGWPNNDLRKSDVITSLSHMDLEALTVERRRTSNEFGAVQHVIGYRPTERPSLYLDCVFHEGDFYRLDMRKSYFPSNAEGDVVFEFGDDHLTRAVCTDLNDRAQET